MQRSWWLSTSQGTMKSTGGSETGEHKWSERTSKQATRHGKKKRNKCAHGKHIEGKSCDRRTWKLAKSKWKSKQVWGIYEVREVWSREEQRTTKSDRNNTTVSNCEMWKGYIQDLDWSSGNGVRTRFWHLGWAHSNDVSILLETFTY